MTIGQVVLEKKIFKGFLPYMVMVAILAMWPGPFEQTFVHEGSTWNLTSISPVVSEEKMFENLDWQTDDTLQTSDHDNTAYTYYKLTSEPKAQVS